MNSIVGKWSIEVYIIIGILLIWVYYKIRSIHGYFERRNIGYIKPMFLLGSDPRLVLGLHSLVVSLNRLYQISNGEKIVGFFYGLKPYYLVRDPEYVDCVLVKHFENFCDRDLPSDPKTNPLDDNIVFMKGNRWRFYRNKLRPVFTQGNIKQMLEIVLKHSEELERYVEKMADGTDVDLSEAIHLYTADVVGSIGFGLELNSLKDPNSKFMKMMRKFFLASWRFVLLVTLRLVAPWCAERFPNEPKDVTEYFGRLLREVFENRKTTKSLRKDFIYFALRANENEMADPEDHSAEEAGKIDNKIRDLDAINKVLCAQGFVFLAAGYHTTANAFYFLIYLLSKNQDVQNKVRKEMKSVKEKFGQFTFESLSEMKYLHNCISETMRLYPPIPFTNRKCVKDFRFPDGTKVNKGQTVFIPTMSIQRDPDYFDEPDVFKPERFDKQPIRGSYLAFGDGPRICIGKSFSLFEMKMTMARLLDKFIFQESPLTKTPIELTYGRLLEIKTPLLVRMKKTEK